MKLLLLLIATIALAGCVRPGDHPISSNCTWTEDDNRSLDLRRISDRRHLRFDAVTAEDMAIRWADKNFGHLPEWEQRCEQCMETLFAGVAKQHGVDVATVSQYSRERDPVADAAVIVGFGILYVFAAYILTGRVRRQFTPDEAGFWIMTLTMALGVGLVGVVGGSLWAIVFEELRLGSGHISFRMNRIPFRHHWVMLFICGVVVFWLVALIRSRLKLPSMNTRTNSQMSLH
jgi:hypothetical protein